MACATAWLGAVKLIGASLFPATFVLLCWLLLLCWFCWQLLFVLWYDRGHPKRFGSVQFFGGLSPASLQKSRDKTKLMSVGLLGCIAWDRIFDSKPG